MEVEREAIDLVAQYRTQHTINGVKIRTREGILWHGMKNRCNGKRHSNYLDCSISDNFMNFQYFAEWCHSQKGWNEDAWQLDKDFLVENNKIYSEDTCVFIPREINNIFNNTKKIEKGLTGAVWFKSINKFQARCSEFGKQVSYGMYSTAEEAHKVWVEKKIKYVKEIAEI